MHLLGISGSLRQGSYNTALLSAARELLPGGDTLAVFEGLREIPPFDTDVLEAGSPAPVLELKRRIREAEAVLIATPEYNWGPPGLLKNALDWAMRPAADSPLRDKPVAIVGASGGPMGTIRAQLQLRQNLYGMARVVISPEVLVSYADRAFDPELRLKDQVARRLLGELLQKLGREVRLRQLEERLAQAS